MKDLLEKTKDDEGKMKDKFEGKHRAYLYMKIFYGFFIAWMGYNILMSEQLIEKNQKYFKSSLLFIKNVTNHYFPNLLSNRKFNKYFDLNTIQNKSHDIINYSCYLFIIGGFMISIGLRAGKIIVSINLILNILLVYNIFYFIGESLKVNVFKYWSLLGATYYI